MVDTKKEANNRIKPNNIIFVLQASPNITQESQTTLLRRSMEVTFDKGQGSLVCNVGQGGDNFE